MRIRLLSLKLFALFVVLALTGCAQLKPLAEDLDLGKPDVSVASVAIAGFDTEHADLLFTLDVDNGNPIAVPLSALAYDLRVAGQSLVSGNSSERIELAAGKVTQVPLTVSVAFADLRPETIHIARNSGTVQNMKDRRHDLYRVQWMGR